MTKKKKPAVKTGPSDQPPTFEAALAELEKIVGDLEDGNTGLNEALQRYEEGVKLLKNCYQLLEKAERRIELLSGVDAEGNPVAEPFEERENSLEEKGQSRSRRRSNPKAATNRQRSSVDDGDRLF